MRSQFSMAKLDLHGPRWHRFEIGIQSGLFGAGTQVNGAIAFHADGGNYLTEQWVPHSIAVAELIRNPQGAGVLDLTEVRSFLFLRGSKSPSHDRIEVRNIYFSRE